MQHESTEVIESKALPGIKFTLVRPVEGHRIELRRMTAATTRKMRPIYTELERVNQKWVKLLPRADMEGKVPPIEVTPEMEGLANRLGELSEEIDFLEHTELEPIWVKWALKAVEGDVAANGQHAGPLTIDGNPVTAENIAYGPNELYKEIVQEIRKRIGLEPAAAKNSSSLTTSTESADGKTSDTTATSAVAPATDSTELETVTVTSPAT